jgi:hypothetical protein
MGAFVQNRLEQIPRILQGVALYYFAPLGMYSLNPWKLWSS